MDSDTALSDIMEIVGVMTPTAAVDIVRLLTQHKPPLLSIEQDGTLQVANGVTVGQALRLLASAQARIESVVIQA